MTPKHSVSFDMVALVPVTINRVDYAPGDVFSIDDPATMRWLVNQKSAKSASLEDAGQEVTGVAAKASGGTTDKPVGTQRGQESPKTAKRTGGAAASK